ncbi:hypothetical protein KI387_023624, partial [Taxus chinensis]
MKENQFNTRAKREKKGKFEPHWLRPYVIVAKYGTGAYKITHPNGDELHEPMNVMHLKWFYALKMVQNQEKQKKKKHGKNGKKCKKKIKIREKEKEKT